MIPTWPPSVQVKCQWLPWSEDRHAQQLRQHQVGRNLLRQLVPTPLAYHALGQPYIPAQPQAGVSITHSRSLVYVAVAPGAIGIDVEAVRPRDFTQLQHAFTPTEWDFLQALAPSLQLAWAWRLWTAKEAVLKLVGCGLTRRPQQVAVNVPTSLTAHFQHHDYQLHVLPTPPGYCGTLALPITVTA